MNEFFWWQQWLDSWEFFNTDISVSSITLFTDGNADGLGNLQVGPPYDEVTAFAQKLTLLRPARRAYAITPRHRRDTPRHPRDTPRSHVPPRARAVYIYRACQTVFPSYHSGNISIIKESWEAILPCYGQIEFCDLK